jgi:hypothetical protein
MREVGERGSENRVVPAGKLPRFLGADNLHSAWTTRQWKLRKKLDFSTYGKGDIVRDEEGSFVLRVIRARGAFSDSSFDLENWATIMTQMDHRTPASCSFSPMVSASLCSLRNIALLRLGDQDYQMDENGFLPDDEPLVGLVLDPSDILVASPSDLNVGYPKKFYESPVAGGKFLTCLARHELPNPQELLRTKKENEITDEGGHNELVCGPSKIVGIFAACPPFDPVTADNTQTKLKAAWGFAERHDLPFVRFSPVPT